jgi:inorganic triphosphatase YgiF
MPQEIELKFDVDPAAAPSLEQRLVVRRGAKAAGPPQILYSVYYDTPARDLQRARLTLRIRQDGARHIQTVKSEAVGLAARGEWETELASNALDLDAIAGTPLEPLLKSVDGALAPVFATRIERTRRLIRQGSAKVEAALDRGQIEAEGRATPLCELELELKSGDTSALFDLARRLAGAAPLRLSFETKAQRGYRLLEGHKVGEAIAQARARLEPGMTVRAGFQAIAAAALRQWVGNAAVLRAARRPEALHQMRVALRRLRTAMALFEDAVTDDAYPHLMAELKWLAGELDQGRDIDVLIADTFRPAAARFHDQIGLAGLGERLLKARTRAYDRALALLDQKRYLNLVLDMAAWIECGAWADPTREGTTGAPLEDLARQGLDKLRRQVKRRGQGLETLDPASRHALRIRAKRLRYAIEFFAGLHPGRKPERSRYLETLKALQDSLGALNDLKFARDQGLALAEGGGRACGDSETEGAQEAFAAGLMIGARLGSQDALLEQARGRYEALMEMKAFWRG